MGCEEARQGLTKVALRTAQALEMVERRLLTVREASEHFGLPVNEIAGSRH